MKVDVSLCGVLRHWERTGAGPGAGGSSGPGAGGSSGPGEGKLELPAGATLGDVAARIGLPDGVEFVACVNGKVARAESPLAEGDEVYLFLPVSGG